MACTACGHPAHLDPCDGFAAQQDGVYLPCPCVVSSRPQSPKLRLRARAVFCCLYFGILPWWIYEQVSHYGPDGGGDRGMGYWRHLGLNLRRAWLWAVGSPSEHEVDFELRVNARPNWTRWHVNRSGGA